MKKWLPVINSVLAIPFSYVLICVLLAYVADLVHWGGMLEGEVTGPLFGLPMIVAYVLLPKGGIFLLPLLTAFVSFSTWKIWPEKRILLGCYLLVFLLYDGYLVWWYATGQTNQLE